MKNKLSKNFFNIIIALFTIIFCQLCPNDVSGFFGGGMFQGRIQNDTYYSQDKSFEVRLPHKTSSNEFRCMRIKEKYAPDNTAILLGPAAMDGTTYEISLMDKLKAPEGKSTDLKDLKDILIEHTVSNRTESGHLKLSYVSETEGYINNYHAYMRVYDGVTTAKLTPTPQNIKFTIYALENARYFAIIAIMEEENTKFSENRNAFINSFRFVE